MKNQIKKDKKIITKQLIIIKEKLNKQEMKLIKNLLELNISLEKLH